MFGIEKEKRMKIGIESLFAQNSFLAIILSPLIFSQRSALLAPALCKIFSNSCLIFSVSLCNKGSNRQTETGR
jgi:hypothetical protein